MNPVLIFRHIECEGPGYLADFLDRQKIPFNMVCIDQNDPIPEQLDNISGLVLMGGSMSVNDDLPWIEPELKLIKQAVEKNLPVLGHCLGGQLISKALGGSISKNPVKEIGWHYVENVEQANNEQANSWLASVPTRFEAFHWHGETFSVPDGATTILKSEQCENQAFCINNTLALQCHIEMTADMVTQWVDLYGHELDETGSHIQSANEILASLQTRIDAMQTIADCVYTKWAEPMIDK
jgi:GMP synthase-like glutamine amidotransferase